MKTKITKELLKELRVEINKALKPVGEKLGLTLNARNASYRADGSGHYKLEFLTLGEDGEERDPSAESFLTYAELVGLKKEDLNREITLKGRRFQIVGYNPKARKNKICIKDQENGKDYVTSLDTAKRALEKASK